MPLPRKVGSPMPRMPVSPSDIEPHLTCQAILMPANPSEIMEEGLLIFADGTLMAVVMHLQQSVSKEYRGLWHLEAGFGPCAAPEACRPTFKTPEGAQLWVRECVVRARAKALT